jgi:hypothetical protein
MGPTMIAHFRRGLPFFCRQVRHRLDCDRIRRLCYQRVYHADSIVRHVIIRIKRSRNVLLKVSVRVHPLRTTVAVGVRRRDMWMTLGSIRSRHRTDPTPHRPAAFAVRMTEWCAPIPQALPVWDRVLRLRAMLLDRCS